MYYFFRSCYTLLYIGHNKKHFAANIQLAAKLAKLFEMRNFMAPLSSKLFSQTEATTNRNTSITNKKFLAP